MDVIEKTPEKLSQVDGIGAKRIADITRAWQEQKEIKDIMIFLQGHSVSATFAAKIFRQYGGASITTVQENPYRLAADIRGIGFVTADKIAQNLGLDPCSVIRVKEGIVYVLNELLGEGHVYYPYLPLLDKTASLLQVDKQLVIESVAFVDRRIILKDLNTADGEFQANYKAVYLPAFHTAETGLARRLISLQAAPSQVRPVNQANGPLVQGVTAGSLLLLSRPPPWSHNPVQILCRADLRYPDPANRRTHIGPSNFYQV